MKKRILFCLLLVIGFNFRVVAQVTTETVGGVFNASSVIDSYVLSSSSNTNYGSSTTFYVGVNSSGDIGRSFVKFDFDNAPIPIPHDAIILSATIGLKFTSSYSTPLSDLSIERVKSSWIETGTGSITYNNAPSANAFGIFCSGTLIAGATAMTANVTSDVQNMVNYPALNFGWRIRLNSETAGHYINFYSKNYLYGLPLSLPINAPYISVTYVLPIKITIDQIIHASSLTSTDGEIHPIITQGDGTYTYKWTKNGGTSIISTSQNLTGVGYGWYGLEVTDGHGIKGYMSFIVGVDCETVPIYYNPGPNYIEDVNVRDLIHNGIDYGNLNEGAIPTLSISRWTWTTYYTYETLMKFHLILDDVLSVSKSDLLLYGNGHNNYARQNLSKIDKLTSDWQELIVTRNTRPSITSTDEILLSGTTSSNQNDQIDIKKYWNYWQQYPDQNFGFIIRLQDEITNSYTMRKYYSSEIADTSLLPKMMFKISVNCQYALLNTSPNGAYYTFKGDHFYVKYNEEYFDVDAELNYEIIDKDNLPVTPSQTITNVYGDNRIGFNVSSLIDGYYTLVVTNDKKEKWYLRFKKGI